MKSIASKIVYGICGVLALVGLVFFVPGGILILGALYGSKLADYLSSKRTWDGGTRDRY